MAKVLWGGVQQLFDNFGDVLNGGTLTFYAGGTVTPLAAYTDSVGGTALANPLTIDSAGREQGGIWFTEGVAYKVLVKDSGGVTLDTIDNITIGEAASADTDEYEVPLVYIGTPGAQGDMGGWHFKRAVTFPIDFSGSGGHVVTDPADTYAIDVQKNGASVGTISIATTGVITFTTSGGTTVAFADGDELSFIAPSSVGTAAGFRITLVGTPA